MAHHHRSRAHLSLTTVLLLAPIAAMLTACDPPPPKVNDGRTMSGYPIDTPSARASSSGMPNNVKKIVEGSGTQSAECSSAIPSPIKPSMS